MCHRSCLMFGQEHLTPERVRGRTVLEVGALDVNGSLRPPSLSLGPAVYTGVDMQGGPGVDVICRVERLTGRFGRASMDVVVSTEMLEHVEDWEGAVGDPRGVLPRA